MSDKAQYSRIHNRDSVIVEPPTRTLRKKVSRAFSTLARRASSTSMRDHAKAEKEEAPPVPPRIERNATAVSSASTGSSNSSSSTRSGSANAVRHNAPQHDTRRETMAGSSAIVQYSYPLWRVDPVLIGCFVCL